MATDPRDLVSKAAVEQWLNSNNPAFNVTSDTVNIPLAITDCSVDWYSFTGRRSLNRFVPCNDTFDGMGGDRQFLRDFPVGLVSAVYVNGAAIPQGSSGEYGPITPGWVLDSKRESISMVGCSPLGYGLGRGAGSGGAYAVTSPYGRIRANLGFGGRNDQGRQNVVVQYFAGGSIMFNEVVTVPLSSPYTVTVSQGATFWNDLGEVYYALPQSGLLVQLGAVLSPTSAGQYSFSQAGVYTFSAGDAGQQVAITYGANQAPPDIQMAVIMQVCETLYTRKSIGLRSQGSPESGTTSYTKSVVTPDVLRVMARYKRAMVSM